MNHGVDLADLQDELEQLVESMDPLFAPWTLSVHDDCLCLRREAFGFQLDAPIEEGGSFLMSSDNEADGMQREMRVRNLPLGALDPCVFYFSYGVMVMWSVDAATEERLVARFKEFVNKSSREQSEDSWIIESGASALRSRVRYFEASCC